jgi:hypothetical protein
MSGSRDAYKFFVRAGLGFIVTGPMLVGGCIAADQLAPPTYQVSRFKWNMMRVGAFTKGALLTPVHIGAAIVESVFPPAPPPKR